MLIYTSKAPGWGKQKPKQYNFAHAQASVRHWCEEWLGVDYGALVGYWPMTEGAGNTLYSMASHSSVETPNAYTDDSVKWADEGLSNNSYTTFTAVSKEIDSPLTLRAGAYTIFFKLADRTYNTSYTRILGGERMGDGHGWFIQKESKDGSHRYKFVANYKSAYVYSTPKPKFVFLTYDGVGVLKTYVNGYLQSVHNAVFTPQSYWGDSSLLRRSFFIKTALADSSPPSVFHQVGITNSVLSADVIAQLSETPYALLQPVAPVFYSLPSALVPRITYPTEGLNDVSTTPTVSWSAVTGATKYKLQVDTANTFDSSAGLPLIENEITAPATSKQVTLAAGTTHYARVAADTP